MMLELQLVPASTTNRANTLDSNELVVLQTTGVEERNSSDLHLHQEQKKSGITGSIERTGPSVGPPDNTSTAAAQECLRPLLPP
jgi:hypothetical protein